MDLATGGKPLEGSGQPVGQPSGRLIGVLVGCSAAISAVLVGLLTFLSTLITANKDLESRARDADIKLTEIRTVAADRIRDAEVKLAEVRAGAEGRARDADVRMVEIGVGVLRAKPDEEGAVAAREWAIELIEKRSGVRFSEEAKAQLMKKRLRYSGPFAGSFDTTWNSGDDSPPAEKQPEAPQVNPPAR